MINNDEKELSIVPCLPPAGAWAGGGVDHHTQGQGERHDHVLARDDGIRAAAGGLRNQQVESQLRRAANHQGVRAQYPGGESGEAGGGHRQLLGARGG